MQAPGIALIQIDDIFIINFFEINIRQYVLCRCTGKLAARFWFEPFDFIKRVRDFFKFTAQFTCKILEAMALGTPVVSTSKGAEGLNVTSGKDILIANEPEEFAQAIVQLLQDGPLRDKLASNARRLVEQHYDSAQIGDQFVDLVEALVEHRVQESTDL